MHFNENSFYHVYNRSFNHTRLFHSTRNYQFFKKKLEGLKSYCEILAYCLMPDHFHLLIYIPPTRMTDETRSTAQSGQTGRSGRTGAIAPSGETGSSGQTGSQILSRKIGTILSSYTQAINKQESRVGSLFQPKTKAKEVENQDHLSTVFHYIHQNPLRSRLVKRMEDWKHSSFNEYLFQNFELANGEICNQFLDLDVNPKEFLKLSNQVIPDHLISPYVKKD